jgi:hypothetical protein
VHLFFKLLRITAKDEKEHPSAYLFKKKISVMPKPEDIYKEYRELVLKKSEDNINGQKFSFVFTSDREGTFTVTNNETKDMIGGTFKLSVNNDGLNILMDYKGFYITQTLKIDKKESTIVREPNSGKVFLTGHKLDMKEK